MHQDNLIQASSSKKTWDKLCSTYHKALTFIEDADADISAKEEFDYFRKCVLNTCIYVAGHKCTINETATNIINIVCGEGYSAYGYTSKYKQIKSNAFPLERSIDGIEFAMLRMAVLRWVTQRQRYTVESDLIVQCVVSMWTAISTANAPSNSNELSNIKYIKSMLEKRAATISGKIDYSIVVTDTEIIEEPNEIVEYTVDSGTLESVFSELRFLVGLDSVKIEVESLTNLAKVFQLRKQRNLAVPDFSFHLVFIGNPGTGKTTVARIIAKIYGHLGLLSKGHVIEVDRAGLVANYVGQTATKVQEVIARAKGGILFIDEAYSLSSGGEKDFGREAIEILLKAMEDQRDDLVVIAAGYDEKMEEFLNSNPGLRSRFPKVISFPDYSPEELAEIFVRTAEKTQYNLTHAAKVTLYEETKRMWMNRGEDFANARDVRNLFERTISAHANRISALPNVTEDILTTVEEVDVATAITAAEPEINLEL